MSKIVDFRSGETVASRTELRRKRRARTDVEVHEWRLKFQQEEVTATVKALSGARECALLGDFKAAYDLAETARCGLRQIWVRRSSYAGARKGADKRKGDKEAAALFAKLSAPSPSGGAL